MGKLIKRKQMTLRYFGVLAVATGVRKTGRCRGLSLRRECVRCRTTGGGMRERGRGGRSPAIRGRDGVGRISGRRLVTRKILLLVRKRSQKRVTSPIQKAREQRTISPWSSNSLRIRKEMSHLSKRKSHPNLKKNSS